MDIQGEALRRKNAGDPRPIPMIIAELSGGAPQGGAPAVAPSPASPVPVGQPVEVQAPAPVAAVPPMSTPYSSVEKARGASAGVSATDVAVANAAQQGKPEADLLTRVRAQQAAALRDEEARMAEIRATAKIDPEMENVFRRREERRVQEAADLAKDEKKQAWNALAMAGFQMAQSTSPYFLSALAAGLQSGFEGFSAAKAAAAEKKARLLDAREADELGRIQARNAVADRMMADRNAAMMAAMRRQDAIAKGMDIETANEMFPLRKEQLQAQIEDTRASTANTYSTMADRKARLAMVRQAGLGGGGGGGGRGRGGVGGGVAGSPDYDIKTETYGDAQERQVLIPKSPGAVSLVEGPYGEWMPKRYADNPAALADAKRAAHKAGAVGYEFSPGGDMLAILPDGRRTTIRHFRRQ